MTNLNQIPSPNQHITPTSTWRFIRSSSRSKLCALRLRDAETIFFEGKKTSTFPTSKQDFIAMCKTTKTTKVHAGSHGQFFCRSLVAL